MIKISKFVEKYDNIIVLLFIIISLVGVILNVGIQNSDELWNFQNVYKLFNGFSIYKDANVIITPLFFDIAKILFKILGANFFIFRIYHLIISSILFFTTYLMLKKIKFSKKMAFIIMCVMILLGDRVIIFIMANYNVMALMLVVIGVFLLIISNKKNKFNYILQGIFFFLIFLTKQNIGIFYGIGLFLYVIFINIENKSYNKMIKSCVLYYITFFVLLFIFIFYYYRIGILYDFINYAFMGINEFATNNAVLDIPYIMIGISMFLINLITSFVLIKSNKIQKEEKNNLIILNCFSHIMLLIMFPMCNKAHFYIGIYLSSVLFIYIIKIIAKDIKKSEKKQKIIVFIFAISFITISGFYFYNWINYILKYNHFDYSEPYFGGIMTEELYKNVCEITNFIKSNGNDGVVISSRAGFYMIPLKRNNGEMDLPFIGNLGLGGEEELIEKIKGLNQNTYILIEKKDVLMFQESKLVRKFILDQYTKIGEIEEFDIYKTD